MGSHFWGSIFGAIFIVFIISIIYVIIVRLFRIKVDNETVSSCFSYICYIALVISFIVFLLNKCSTLD